MNCQQFTILIVEAARGQMLDAAARDGAMRHAESCEVCTARLAQEQNLTAVLRTVALSVKETGAPARIEAKLLAAFQESLSSSNAATTNAAPVSLPERVATRAQGSNLRSRRLAMFASAIAASLVLVVLAALYREFIPTTPPQETTTNGKPSGIKDSPPVNAIVVPTPTLATSGTAAAQQPKRETVNTKQRVESERAFLKLARGTRPRMLTSRQVIDGGSAIIEASGGEATLNGAGGEAKSNEAERVTEFISLVAGAPAATPLEGGQLVRVQLPRAALASLGLPLNVERENESVKADVLLGNDGLARAIRFVR